MKRSVTFLNVLAVCAGAGAMAGWAGAAPVVENYKSLEAVRHGVVLLRGKVERGAEKLTLRTAAGTGKPVEGTGLVHDGKFKALVELGEGDNTVELKTEKTGLPLKLKLTYKPITNSYYVRLIWLTDSTGNTDYAVPDESTPQNYEARLATAARLMQSFTAERMQELGYGRRTFKLETDRAGKPVVHTVKAPHEASYYYTMGNDNRMWGEIGQFLNVRMPDPKVKNLVLMSFTRKDPATGRMMAHTALGGGNLGLFGSASMFSWPDNIAGVPAALLDDRKVDDRNVHGDSAGRGLYWAVASTTLGATLHEMGHTFGLPHCRDGRCIMTRGFDRLNRFVTFADLYPGRNPEYFPADEEAWFAPVSASFLRWSPWFQPESPGSRNEPGPELEFDSRKEEVTVESRAGVRWVGFYDGGDIRGFKEFKDKNGPRKVSLTRTEILDLNDGKIPDKITAADENGRVGEVKVSFLKK